MKTFKYSAVDSQGGAVKGTVEAHDWTTATRLLEQRGLSQCRQSAEEVSAATEAPALTTAESLELAGYVSELAKAGLPLSAGLRAAAGEVVSPRLSSSFATLAGQLESGRSLESALEALASALPPHIRRLLTAGARSGQVHQTLDALLAHERSMDDMTRRFWQATLYPLTLLLFFAGWVLFVSIVLVPSLELESISMDYFGRPATTEAGPRFGKHLREFARVVPPLLLATLGVTVVGLALALLTGGAALVSRIASALPLFGQAWRYRSLVEFTGLLSVFLKRHLPLDEALDLVSLAARDPAIREASGQLSGEVRAGGDLATRLADRRIFPPTLACLVQWGQQNALIKALDCARTMYADRFELQVRLARLVLPPIVFLLVGGSALFVAYQALGSVLQAIRDLA
jgi:type II secretory pathway component PulF